MCGINIVLIQSTIAMEDTSGIKKRRSFSVVSLESKKSPAQEMTTRMLLNKKIKLNVPDL